MDDATKQKLTENTHRWWSRLNVDKALTGKETVELQNFLAWVEAQVKGEVR